MKKFTQLALAAALATSASVATAEISANVTLASDYVWRGISQTQNTGAIQGGFDYEHKSGFYAGAWASNVDFTDAGAPDAQMELDLYAGYGFDITEELSADVGVLKYTYPGGNGGNFTETYANLSYKGFTLGYAASGTITADESTDYISVSYETELPAEVGLSVSYGIYDYKDATFTDSDGSTEDDYSNWSLGLSKSFFGLDFGLTYTDTDLDSDECASFAGDKDYCDGIVTVSMSKSM